MRWLVPVLPLLLACPAKPPPVIIISSEPNPAHAVPAETVPLDAEVECVSLLGKPLLRRTFAPEARAALEADLSAARAELLARPDDEAAWIWVGRRLAYLGRFRDAIAHYTKALERFPDSYRLRRHRGHRYLSVREFDAAIADLTRAAELADAFPNELEPDGRPNAAGIPISSTHGNIQYHLGLAHFWKDELEAAQHAFARAASFALNDDAICSSHWWLFVMEQRLGHHAAADLVLEAIRPDMQLVENFGYQQLLLLFQGNLAVNDLVGGEDGASEAVQYGVSLWYQSQGDEFETLERWGKLVDEGRWDAFGTLSAEVELARRAR